MFSKIIDINFEDFINSFFDPEVPTLYLGYGGCIEAAVNKGIEKPKLSVLTLQGLH